MACFLAAGHIYIYRLNTVIDECTIVQNSCCKDVILNAYTMNKNSALNLNLLCILNNVWSFFPHQLGIGFVLELVNLWAKLHR